MSEFEDEVFKSPSAWADWGHGDVIEATFNPKIVETLRPESKEHVGKRYIFKYCWHVTEEDGGDYVGQPVFANYDNHVSYFGWVPLEDLDDIRIIR